MLQLHGFISFCAISYSVAKAYTVMIIVNDVIDYSSHSSSSSTGMMSGGMVVATGGGGGGAAAVGINRKNTSLKSECSV